MDIYGKINNEVSKQQALLNSLIASKINVHNDYKLLSIDFLDELEFNGIDFNTMTSLSEYQIISKQVDNNIILLVGVNTNSDGYFIDYALTSITLTEYQDLINEYANKGFYNYIGQEFPIDENEFDLHILSNLISYHGICLLGDLIPEYKVIDYAETIKDLLTEYNDKKEEFDNYEFNDNLYDEYDEFLDCLGAVNIGNMEFYPSDVLKNCDPIAYRCGYSDFTSNIEEDKTDELEEEVEEFKTNLIDQLEEFYLMKE